MFGWNSWQLLLAELGTLALVWYIGTRGASSSANLQTVIAGLIVALIVAIWWAGDIKPANIPFPAPGNIELTGLFAALSVMFWCFVGLEAFAHLASEFKNPERDFPRALMIGLLLAGLVYWGCTVVVLHFDAYGEQMKRGSIASKNCSAVVRCRSVMDCLRDWLSGLLCQSQHLYTELRPPGLVAGAT